MANPAATVALDTEFTRGLGLYDSTMVVIGSMIGSGIFIVSAEMARNVKREDLIAGAGLLGLPLEEHIGNVIAFMRERAEALGLRGTL